MLSSLLTSLANQLRTLSARGRALPLTEFGSLRERLSGLSGAIDLVAGTYWRSCDNVGLLPVQCGTAQGLVLAVSTGNCKDMGTAIASGAAMVELAACFESPLLSEADLVPTLRTWMLRSDERIRALSAEPTEGLGFGTVNGTRSHLRGIGCAATAVAVLPHRLYGIHLGDGKAFLVRDGKSKKLTIEHTLANDPAFRKRDLEHEGAEFVVLRILGLSESSPAPDVFRIDLRQGDRIVLGNGELTHEDTQELPDDGASSTVSLLLSRIESRRLSLLTAVGCVRVASA